MEGLKKKEENSIPDCQLKKMRKSNHLHNVEHSNYVNNFLSTNPTTLTLSSLVSAF